MRTKQNKHKVMALLSLCAEVEASEMHNEALLMYLQKKKNRKPSQLVSRRLSNYRTKPYATYSEKLFCNMTNEEYNQFVIDLEDKKKEFDRHNNSLELDIKNKHYSFR